MFEKINNEALLIECQKAVRVEKKSTARVLEYLSEIDRRRLWLKEGFSSLHDFCIRFLNYSESEANRRIQACRLSVKVEEIKPLLEEGTLSLTTISMLSPYLTDLNAKTILPEVVKKSSRQVEKVLDSFFPDRERKKEYFEVETDAELKALLEEAKLLASERDPKEFMKKVLRAFVREKRPRKTTIKKHTRYVPLPLAREVKKDYGYQCAYVSHNGIRCNQWAHLQIDHKRSWGLGGSSHDKTNLRPLCRAHNLYMAKLNFGEKVPALMGT